MLEQRVAFLRQQLESRLAEVAWRRWQRSRRRRSLCWLLLLAALLGALLAALEGCT